ncbi:MAG TPA: ATP-binding cassette domain-containing protein, partial [Terriglobales bacterium]|nr:ATP-binding cassette domain-containing protein [Terriglobales bacterium]
MSGGPKVPFLASIKKRFDTFDLAASLECDIGITILFGASGAGKSTLLRSIAGLMKPDSGHVRIVNDVLYDSVKKIDVPPPDRRIGFVFQNLA